MRVISGSARGTKLLSPANEDIRPTSDKVKEAVFGALQFQLVDKQVLDLFAGSGALGIEALSRGAKGCTFIDKSRSSIRLIEQNVGKANVAQKSEIRCADALQFMNQTQSVFDIIFIDPPYHAGIYNETLNKLNEKQILSKEGMIVCESSEPLNYEPFEAYKIKKYGNTIVAFLRYCV